VKKMTGSTILLPNEVFRFVLKLREEPKLEHIKVQNASHCFYQEKEWSVYFSWRDCAENVDLLGIPFVLH
jgi:hypothetical protein